MHTKQKKNTFNKKETRKGIRSFIITLILTIALLGTVVVMAGKSGKSSTGSGPLVKVELSGTVEREGRVIPVADLESVIPQEVLHWKIVSRNEGDDEASQYKAFGKIPSGTVYVPESAKAEDSALVKFSIDGGNSFAKKPMIEEKQADGSVKRVSAPVEMYTDIRFEWAKPLGPDKESTASYDVRVK